MCDLLTFVGVIVPHFVWEIYHLFVNFEVLTVVFWSKQKGERCFSPFWYCILFKCTTALHCDNYSAGTNNVGFASISATIPSIRLMSFFQVKTCTTAMGTDAIIVKQPCKSEKKNAPIRAGAVDA